MWCKFADMNELAAYLSETGISQRAFAKDIATDPSVVSRFVSGAARPGLDLAFVIEEVTTGRVPASCWRSETKGAAL